jgi:hypothetical protein
MNQAETIKNINARTLRGVFVEIGCGMPVSDAIFSEEGASNTIYTAISPYSKVEQERLFGNKYERSVSKDFIEVALEYTTRTYPESKLHFVSSFQVNNQICSHGWIGILYEGNKFIYHVTFNKFAAERRARMEMIKEIGLSLIFNKGTIKSLTPYDATIDAAYGENLVTLISSMTRNYYGSVFINKNGQTQRLETFLRNKETVVAYKGSFDKIHTGHLEIAKHSKDTLFVLSTRVHEKGAIEPEALAKRTKLINSLGYDVLIINTKFFEDFVDFLRNRGYMNKIEMVMGRDTAIRLWTMKNFKNNPNVSFIYFDRDKLGEIDGIDKNMFHFHPLEHNISSTLIRKKIEEKDIEFVKKYVPEPLLDEYLK